MSGSGNINLNQDSLNNVGQLYNLENDPYETNDLYSKNPEKVTELKKVLKEKAAPPIFINSTTPIWVISAWTG